MALISDSSRVIENSQNIEYDIAHNVKLTEFTTKASLKYIQNKEIINQTLEFCSSTGSLFSVSINVNSYELK